MLQANLLRERERERERGWCAGAFSDYKHCRPTCVRIRFTTVDSERCSNALLKIVSCCRVCGAACPNDQNITFDVTRIDSYLLVRDWPIHFATHDVAEPTVTLARSESARERRRALYKSNNHHHRHHLHSCDCRRIWGAAAGRTTENWSCRFTLKAPASDNFFFFFSFFFFQSCMIKSVQLHHTWKIPFWFSFLRLSLV